MVPYTPMHICRINLSDLIIDGCHLEREVEQNSELIAS
jgi:hypothetical protein